MNLTELDRALRQLRLSGMADVLEARLRHAQTERLSPLDLVATLVSDELQRRQDRLFDRRHKQARFRDPDRSLDRFDFDFNKKMNRALLHELATARFVGKREDALFLGPPGTAVRRLVWVGKHQLGNAAWGASFPSERALPAGAFGSVHNSGKRAPSPSFAAS